VTALLLHQFNATVLGTALRVVPAVDCVRRDRAALAETARVRSKKLLTWTWIGTLIGSAWLLTARSTACRIHHIA